MSPFHKILCPVDFSTPGHAALTTAAALAQQFAAELWVIHVVMPVTSMPVPTVFPEAVNVPGVQLEMETAARQALDDTLANHVPAAVRAHSMVLEGDPADEIERFVPDHGIDLIVISTHGHSGLERLMFGSVAQRVIRAAPCAVLSIRAKPAKAHHEK